MLKPAHTVAAAVLGLFLTGPWTSGAPAERRPGTERARAAVEAILGAAEGTFGVAAKHLESGEAFDIAGAQAFPLASVFKLPILTEVMAQVRDGRFALSDEWALEPKDQFYAGSLLSDLKAPGVRLSVENVINMMMWLSDNTATDLLLGRVGIDAVNARMRSLGIEGILVGRTVRELLLDYFLGESRGHLGRSKDEVAGLVARRAAEDPRAQARAMARFGRDPSDHGTPLAVNALLEKIFRKQALDAPSCERILRVMEGCQTGPGRIRGLLPPGTVVAHKTGTIGGTINDCGIITLPDGAGHVALSILSEGTDPDRAEETIALVARAVYDYFLFTGD